LDKNSSVQLAILATPMKINSTIQLNSLTIVNEQNWRHSGNNDTEFNVSLCQKQRAAHNKTHTVDLRQTHRGLLYLPFIL
jgi:hypothetical protein